MIRVALDNGRRRLESDVFVDVRRRSVLRRLVAVVRAFRFALWVVIAGLPSIGYCQIYSGTSEQSGAVVLSSFATPEASVLLMPAPSASVLSGKSAPSSVRADVSSSGRTVSEALRRIVETSASRAEISPKLIHAVIEAESHYEPKAVSSRGAIGLMQLLPSTAKRFGASDPFDPAQNVSAGTAYLKWLMGFFDQDLELVLAAYNAGEQAVVRAGRKIPPYAETQAYVKKVMATLRRDSPQSL